MDFEGRVEIELSAANEEQLLLKYGPPAKARSYAATHYSYISKGRYASSCHSSDPGTILVGVFKSWCNIPQNERVTLARNHYYIKIYGYKCDADDIEFALHLPGIQVLIPGKNEGRKAIDAFEDNERIIRIPKSFEHHEWLEEVSSIRQASLSLRPKAIRVGIKNSVHKRALQAQPAQKKLWDLQEEQALSEKKVGPTRETRPEQPTPPKKRVRHDYKVNPLEEQNGKGIHNERSRHEKKERRPDRSQREESEHRKRRSRHRGEARYKARADSRSRTDARHERRERREKVSRRRKKGFLRRLWETIFC